MMRRLLLLALLLWAAPASAKNLCVNASTGSDSNTYSANTASGTDGSGTSCWATVYRAARGVAPGGGSDNGAQAAAAGDTVYVATGTYSQPGEGTRFAVALNPANSGTAGNYITFQCATYGACTLTLSSSTGPVLGANGKSYIKWIGFEVDEANATPVADTGPVVCNGSNHIWFEHNTITADTCGHCWGDNHPGIRVEACDSAEIRHNIITGFVTCDSGTCTNGSPVNVANGAGIQFYESDDVVIEYNTFSGNGSAVFVKGPGGVPSLRPIIRYNLVTSGGLAIVLGGVTDARVYQNAGYGITDTAVKWWTLEATATPTGSWVINNTFVIGNGATAVGVGLYDTSGSSTGNRHENNIYSGSSYANYGDSGGSQPRYTSADYNVFYNYSTQFAVYSGGNQSLATWRSTWSIDANSLTSNPLLVSSTDLRLCTGSGTPAVGCSGASPAIALGVDRLDLDGDSSTVDAIPAGAYITGNETLGADGTAGGGGGGGGSSNDGGFRLRFAGGDLPWPGLGFQTGRTKEAYAASVTQSGRLPHRRARALSRRSVRAAFLRPGTSHAGGEDRRPRKDRQPARGRSAEARHAEAGRDREEAAGRLYAGVHARQDHRGAGL